MARSQKFPVKDFNTMGGDASQVAPLFGPLRALTSSPSVASGMPSILGKAFKGEL
jgi:hypothetical protein